MMRGVLQILLVAVLVGAAQTPTAAVGATDVEVLTTVAWTTADTSAATLTVVVGNVPEDAGVPDDVVVAVRTPSGTTGGAADLTAGTWDGAEWTVEGLGAGSSARLDLALTVDGDGPFELCAEAIAYTDELDEDSSPDDGTGDDHDCDHLGVVDLSLDLHFADVDRTPQIGGAHRIGLLVATLSDERHTSAIPSFDATVFLSLTPDVFAYDDAVATGRWDYDTNRWFIEDDTTPTGDGTRLLLDAGIDTFERRRVCAEIDFLRGNLRDEGEDNTACTTINAIDVSVESTAETTERPHSYVYTVDVANEVGRDATGGTVVGVGGTSHISSATTSAGTFEPTTGTWRVGMLPSGSTATLEIVADVTFDEDDTGLLCSWVEEEPADDADSEPQGAPVDPQFVQDDEDCVEVTRDVAPLRRLSGIDREATAVAVSRATFSDDTADTVVLARRDDFADGLAGTPFAAARNGPLLLTATGVVSAMTMTEIARVLPDGGVVQVLGGPTAVSEDVVRALSTAGYDVRRIGGRTRYDTAANIAGRTAVVEHVLLASGHVFADALAAGPAAVARNGVVLLTDGSQPAAATSAYLAGLDPQIPLVAVGGPAARAHPDATGLVGATREHTAVLVATRFFPSADVVGLARADDFPDALAGGVHIAGLGGPMLLTAGDRLADVTRAHLRDGRDAIASVWVYGGTAALSPDVATAAVTAVSDRRRP